MTQTIHPAKLDIAIGEAERFLQRAKALRAATLKDVPRTDYTPSSPQNAAAFRASVDLSKALADMRKGQWRD